MNTGINDAVNLAWKLAAVVQGRASPSLLDSYEPERIAFARRLVATTDRVFTAVTSPTALARLIRTQVAPHLLPVLVRSASVRRFIFRTISQTAMHYRAGPLSEGRAGRLRGGDRLPWVVADASKEGHADNFAPLTSLDWQVHGYGDLGPEVRAACAARRLPVHVFPWGSAAQGAGMERNALYLVRPDGYIGLVDPGASVAKLEYYLDSRGIQPASRAETASLAAQSAQVRAQ
jgi:FAD binding domain-containing protein